MQGLSLLAPAGFGARQADVVPDLAVHRRLDLRHNLGRRRRGAKLAGEARALEGFGAKLVALGGQLSTGSPRDLRFESHHTFLKLRDQIEDLLPKLFRRCGIDRDDDRLFGSFGG